jgi:pyruvate ferredoxin oxidoreductase gamma subunit
MGQIPDLFAGLAPDGFVLLNTSQKAEQVNWDPAALRLPAEHRVTVDATAIARKHLGRPLPNAALLGAFAALTGQLKLESVQRAILEKFTGKAGAANSAAAAEAHDALARPVAAA